MSDIEITVVPKDLYYHEVAYVRGLEAQNADLMAALKGARGFIAVETLKSDRAYADMKLKQIDAALAAAGHPKETRHGEST